MVQRFAAAVFVHQYERRTVYLALAPQPAPDPLRQAGLPSAKFAAQEHDVPFAQRLPETLTKRARVFFTRRGEFEVVHFRHQGQYRHASGYAIRGRPLLGYDPANVHGACRMPPVRIALMVRFDPAEVEALSGIDPRIEVLDHGEAMRGAGPDDATKAAILHSLANVEIMVGTNRLAAEYFDAAPGLRWFQAMNAGLERLDRAGILQRGFAVTNGSGLAAAPIAEWCIAAMLALAKQFPTFVRNQDRHAWERVRGGIVLEGKTCGIVGVGAIGRETAKRARALGMRVIGCRRTADGPDPDCDEMLAYSDLHALLAQSDFVVLCVPLTRETTHLIDALALKAMKPSASILNIARGEVIDQDALIAALKDGTIASAALDVATPEPLPPGSPLWDLPNVLITPHSSGASDRREGTGAALFMENLRRYLANEPLRNLAKPDLGY